jgi:hypothetical protein
MPGKFSGMKPFVNISEETGEVEIEWIGGIGSTVRFMLWFGADDPGWAYISDTEMVSGPFDILSYIKDKPDEDIV